MTGGERDNGRVPRDRGIDATLSLAVEGYEFISRRCRRHRSDVFETRLLLQRTICIRGAEAARLFYDTERFQRSGATPTRVQKTLFGQGGVQGLDGDAHRRRKGLFMSLMTPEAIRDLTTLFAERLCDEIDRWQHAHTVVVHDHMGRILCEAVCAWTGVPLDESELQRRVRDLRAMIESPAKVGPAHWRGRVARKRAERWAGGIVEQVRGGSLEPPEGRALHAIAWHRDAGGELLDTHAAAVELLNVVRPTVAIDRFVTFAAVALHDHPQWRERLRDGGDDVCERFVQEVRRFYPFFPVAAARVRRPFDWNGVRFERGRRVLLDLFGTNQDPRAWEHPRRFDPDRFREWSGNPFDFIPQGGGDHHDGHRCAGEWITIELMKTAVGALTRWMDYDVPAQDLRISRGRIPALPHQRIRCHQRPADGVAQWPTCGQARSRLYG